MIRKSLFALLFIAFASSAYAGECILTELSKQSFIGRDNNTKFIFQGEKDWNQFYKAINQQDIYLFDIDVGGLQQKLVVRGAYEIQQITTEYKDILSLLGQFKIQFSNSGILNNYQLNISSLPNREYKQSHGDVLVYYTEACSANGTNLIIKTWNRENHQEDKTSCKLNSMPTYSFYSFVSK